MIRKVYIQLTTKKQKGLKKSHLKIEHMCASIITNKCSKVNNKRSVK